MNNNDRFTLRSGKRPGAWEATDNENGIVITFMEHRFNDTQKVSLLSGNKFKTTDQAMAIPTAIRELADWLRKEHYDTAMPSLHVLRDKMGTTIRDIRIQRGMTQQDLADAAGITKANVCNIEAGKYSVGLDVLNRIANALDVKIEMK